MDTCDLIQKHSLKSAFSEMIDAQLAENREQGTVICSDKNTGDIILGPKCKGDVCSVLLPKCIPTSDNIANFHTHKKSIYPSDTDILGAAKVINMTGKDDNMCIGRKVHGDDLVCCYRFKSGPVKEILGRLKSEEISLDDMVRDIRNDIIRSHSNYVDECCVGDYPLVNKKNGQ